MPEDPPKKEFRLERLAVGMDPPSDAAIITLKAKLLETCAKHVCQVFFEMSEHEKTPVGTGFLVGPDLVLTNYHVVKLILDKVVALKYLRFRFDRRNLVSGRRDEGFSVGATEIVDWSSYARAESESSEPTEQELDFALVRLDYGVGAEGDRGWIPLPTESQEVQPTVYLGIVQHPRGKPLQVAVGRIEWTPFNAGRTRIRYRVGTDDGSSGSPVFDANVRLIALHHAAIHGSNQGVPIWLIANRPKVREAIPTPSPPVMRPPVETSTSSSDPKLTKIPDPGRWDFREEKFGPGGPEPRRRWDFHPGGLEPRRRWLLRLLVLIVGTLLAAAATVLVVYSISNGPAENDEPSNAEDERATVDKVPDDQVARLREAYSSSLSQAAWRLHEALPATRSASITASRPAQVLLGLELLCETPCNLSVPVVDHDVGLSVRRSRYQDHEETVNLADFRALHVELERLPSAQGEEEAVPVEPELSSEVDEETVPVEPGPLSEGDVGTIPTAPEERVVHCIVSDEASSDLLTIGHCASASASWGTAEMRVFGSAVLYASTGRLEYEVQFYTSTPWGGPCGYVSIGLEDSAGTLLTEMRTQEACIGGLHRHYSRAFTGEFTVPDAIAERTASIRVSAHATGRDETYALDTDPGDLPVE